MPLENNYGAVWEGKNLPQAPLTMQITNGAGTSVVAANAIPAGAKSGDVATTVQFTSSS